MSAVKIIAIVVLLLVGAHLLLYGSLRRKVNAAKEVHELQEREKSD